MRRRAAALGGLVLALYAGFLGWIELRSGALAASPAITRPAGASHVVAVAFYDDWPERRRLRTMTAARLLETGQADYLVTVGGWRPGRGGYLGSRVMREDALAGNLDPDHVLHDTGSNDSVSNLAGAKATIARAIGEVGALVLVSDRYHLLRLSLLAHKAGLATPLQFRATPDDLAITARFGRLNYELLAYLSLLLPDDVARYAIDRLRLADLSSATAG